MREYTLDEKDHEIIRVLRDDSRASIRNIARQTGLRPSTVHQRINRLKNNGVIEKFTIKLNDEKIGEKLTVFMLVSGSLERYLDMETQRDKHIKEVCGLTGEYDLLLKMKFGDMREFNEFIIDFRDKYHKYITKTITMVQTIKLKEE